MTTPSGAFTPYSTLTSLFPATKPTWIPEELDQERILSYQIYEEIYWNVPDGFKLVWRGTADQPIYLPSARSIIESVNRYTAPDFSFILSPTVLQAAGPDEVVLAQEYISDLFTRERFASKFASNKRYGLIRGDWLWYVVADPIKPQGSRISLRTLDPASYFPIFDPDDIERVVGCHIVDQYIPPGESKAVIKRTTYRKPGFSVAFPTSPWVTASEAIFDLDDWEGPKSQPTTVIKPEVPLNGIPVLPVYHIRNIEEPSNPFGSSQIRGFERIITALNQGISDQELSLALEGLGVYTTTAPTPTDATGNEVAWQIGPGRVLQIPAGDSFQRVPGVGSVSPYSDHFNFLLSQLHEAAGTPDIARGAVDVSVAASGVALSLQMSPMLAQTGEKDIIISEVHAQMGYDLLSYWLPVYEAQHFTGMKFVPTIGDKLPVDRTAMGTELNNMLDRGVITTAYYRAEMGKVGYVFPENIGAEALAEKASFATADDPFAARAATELTDPTLTDPNSLV